VFWAIFVYETPERHPFISQKEIKFINEGQGREKTSEVSNCFLNLNNIE
jgi:hypothetical protein